MPISCPAGFKYVVKSGDTLFLIAECFGTTVTQILNVNGNINPNNLQVGQEICIPVPATSSPVYCPDGTAYTIKAGDTFSGLSLMFNTTVTAIQNANIGIDPNNLLIGQVICIPQVPTPTSAPRPSCILLSPTDIAPNSKGTAFIEFDIGSVFALVTNVPKPAAIQGGEVYKLWIIQPEITPAVTTMQELIPGYWMAQVISDFPLHGANILVSSEKVSNKTFPAGFGIAVGMI